MFAGFTLVLGLDLVDPKTPQSFFFKSRNSSNDKGIERD